MIIIIEHKLIFLQQQCCCFLVMPNICFWGFVGQARADALQPLQQKLQSQDGLGVNLRSTGRVFTGATPNWRDVCWIRRPPFALMTKVILVQGCGQHEDSERNNDYHDTWRLAIIAAQVYQIRVRVNNQNTDRMRSYKTAAVQERFSKISPGSPVRAWPHQNGAKNLGQKGEGGDGQKRTRTFCMFLVGMRMTALFTRGTFHWQDFVNSAWISCQWGQIAYLVTSFLLQIAVFTSILKHRAAVLVLLQRGLRWTRDCAPRTDKDKKVSEGD